MVLESIIKLQIATLMKSIAFSEKQLRHSDYSEEDRKEELKSLSKDRANLTLMCTLSVKIEKNFSPEEQDLLFDIISREVY